MNRYEWHRWFAWYPVSAGWLRWVECRVVGYVVTDEECPELAGNLEARWEYRKEQNR